MKDFLGNKVTSGDVIYCWSMNTNEPNSARVVDIIEPTRNIDKARYQARVTDFGYLFSREFIVSPKIVETEVMVGDTVIFKSNNEVLSKGTVEHISDDLKNAMVVVSEFVKYTVDKNYLIKIKNGKQNIIKHLRNIND
jgi:hypothetical protein